MVDTRTRLPDRGDDPAGSREWQSGDEFRIRHIAVEGIVSVVPPSLDGERAEVDAECVVSLEGQTPSHGSAIAAETENDHVVGLARSRTAFGPMKIRENPLIWATVKPARKPVRRR